MGWRPGCAGRWRCMSGCSNGKGMLQKDFIASGTSGVHLVLSTSARSKRNNPPAAEHLSRTCVHLDVPEAYVLFFVTSPHIYSRTRVLLHHEFHDLQHPLFYNIVPYNKRDASSFGHIPCSVSILSGSDDLLPDFFRQRLPFFFSAPQNHPPDSFSSVSRTPARFFSTSEFGYK